VAHAATLANIGNLSLLRDAIIFKLGIPLNPEDLSDNECLTEILNKDRIHKTRTEEFLTPLLKIYEAIRSLSLTLSDTPSSFDYNPKRVGLTRQIGLASVIVEFGDSLRRCYTIQNVLYANKRELGGLMMQSDVNPEAAAANRFIEDWNQLSIQLDRYIRSLKHVYQILSEQRRELASIHSDEEPNKDKRTINRVTYLSTVFLPFSLVADVFSMNEAYISGGPKFGIF
jgi:Mg2+ and Co2+ transporter CorA